MTDMPSIWDWIWYTAHAISPVAIIATVFGFIPAFAALVAIVFYLIEIYETATIQTWLHTRRIRKVATLKIRLALLEASEAKGSPREHEKQ